MASGEIRLSTTTMRRMPVLAQSPQAPAPQATQPCPASVANNPKAGRNILASAVAGAGAAGTIYTVIALVNLEDGGGEAMLALRAAQVASNSESVMFASDALEAVASASGTVDAGIAAANGAGSGFALGSGVGVAITPSICAGNGH